MPLVLLTVIILLSSFYSFAQPEKINIKNWGFVIDQDFLVKWFGLNEDMNYTMGLGYSNGSNMIGYKKKFIPLHFISRLLGHDTTHSKNYHFSMIANGSFTPSTISAKEILYDDRPYGSVTVYQTGEHFYDKNRFQSTVNTFALGIFGTFMPKILQRSIHSLTGDPLPNGWPNQISNKGEPTLLITSQKEFLLWSPLKKKPVIDTHHLRDIMAFNSLPESKFSAEVKCGYKVNLGYHVSANGIFHFRIGKINPANWTNSSNSLEHVNSFDDIPARDAPDQNSRFKRSLLTQQQPEFYFFGGLRPKFMFYNALMQGQFFYSPHTVSAKEMKNCILEFDLGFGGTCPGKKNKNKAIHWKIRFSGRTPEFEFPTRAKRTHTWGGLEFFKSLLW